ncbi:GRAM domain-containing protein 2B isoform X2 [Trichomycterus rosablanca]|uniref:GRAM domain-containing protein 2B isoform X2 n=1 Tax=Trichomycterus rosablanca TaxID=2290929 RepID=UPI002F3591B7
MEKPLVCDDSVLRHKNNARPTCSVSPSQQTEHLLQCQDTENGGDQRSRKVNKSDAPMSEDTESEILERKRTRSRTFDPSLLSPIQSDTDSKIERKKPQCCNFPRTNSQYHKIFKDIREDEQLKQSYTCALQKDILYQGRLFVSDNWVCFHSKVFGKDTKISIPVTSVTFIKKTRTAILVPNALIIATAQDRYVFVSFLSRDATYKVLMSVCCQLDDKCMGSSPIPSSADRNYRMTHSTLPMNFSADLSDLDGPVIQRRKRLGDSSSSDSEKYEKIPEHKWNMDDIKALRPASLNTLLVVYLFLVCILVLSSCCMAFKLIYLEQRLTSLMAEFSYNGDEYDSVYPDVTSRIYSTLSIHLLKLEKIQKQLERLLEESGINPLQ